MSGDKKAINYAFELFNSMQKDSLSYIFRGVFTQKITDNILSLTEYNLEKSSESSKIRKRIFTIMVEGLQNITRHQVKKSNIDAEFGIFLIQNKGNKYFITTGNPIHKKGIPSLIEQLQKINNLSSDELKQYYKEVLNNNIISDKGGAGLGLIEMVRKSKNKLTYDFVDLSENYSYFYLSTEVSYTQIDKEIIVEKDTALLENVKSIHQVLNNKNIVLIFNGLFNQKSLLNLLSMIKDQMIEHDLNLKKKVFNIMVEMLQNIVKHGANGAEISNNPGIFFISQNDKQYQLNTGNYILNCNVKILTERIEYINSLSQDKLNEFYNKGLFNFQNEKSGLGLIELRLKTNRNLSFEINKYNNKYSFFVLQTLVD